MPKLIGFLAEASGLPPFLPGILNERPNDWVAGEAFRMAVYRFGAFEFDSETGELHTTGHRARLRPQPAKLLEHLLQRPGQLVSRAELQRAIWPEGTFVHFDDGLNSCLKQIRAALGGRRPAAACVETLVRRGFRFIAPVTMVPARLVTSSLTDAPGQPAGDDTPRAGLNCT